MHSVQKSLLAVTLIGAAFIARPSEAAVVLDQSQTNDDFVIGPTGTTTIWQTFTVGTAGTLDHIDVQLRIPFPGNFGGANIDYDLVLSLKATDSGGPVGSALATDSASYTELVAAVDNVSGSFVTFDLSAANVAVLVGQVLAFELTGDASGGGDLSNHYNVFVAGSDVYAGGEASISNDDVAFRTYVNTSTEAVAAPEPASLALLGLGLVGVGALRSRRRR